MRGSNRERVRLFVMVCLAAGGLPVRGAVVRSAQAVRLVPAPVPPVGGLAPRSGLSLPSSSVGVPLPTAKASPPQAEPPAAPLLPDWVDRESLIVVTEGTRPGAAEFVTMRDKSGAVVELVLPWNIPDSVPRLISRSADGMTVFLRDLATLDDLDAASDLVVEARWRTPRRQGP